MHSWWPFLAARCKALCPNGFKKKMGKKGHTFYISYLCNENNYEETNCSTTKVGLLLSVRPQFLISTVQCDKSEENAERPAHWIIVTVPSDCHSLGVRLSSGLEACGGLNMQLGSSACSCRHAHQMSFVQSQHAVTTTGLGTH